MDNITKELYLEELRSMDSHGLATLMLICEEQNDKEKLELTRKELSRRLEMVHKRRAD